MFTGIIEELGSIIQADIVTNGMNLTIECSKILEDINLGDSICVNGCCQTVVDFNKKWFKTNLSPETLKVTNFSQIKSGQKVNLERAMSANSRFGGHIVQGHIDGVGILQNIKNNGSFYQLNFSVENDLLKYIINKGSITINGISLTVSEILQNGFEVVIIPHTFENTILQFAKIGDKMNIETDIIGRYVEKMLGQKNNESKIDEKFLKENGFV